MESEWFTEKINYYRGIRYAIVLNTRLGYRCGYVQIPENCPFYDMDLSDLEEKHDFVSIEPTFAGKIKMQSGYWVGWDHHHTYDGVDIEAIRKAHPDKADEYINLAVQLQRVDDGDNISNFATKNDVEQECYNFIEELIKKYTMKD